MRDLTSSSYSLIDDFDELFLLTKFYRYKQLNSVVVQKKSKTNENSIFMCFGASLEHTNNDASVELRLFKSL